MYISKILGEKNYKTPKTFKELDKILLKKVPKEWKNYDAVLPRPLKLGKLKTMKLLKNNFKEVFKKPSLLLKECTIRIILTYFMVITFLEKLSNCKKNDRRDFDIFLNSNEFNPHNLFICKNHLLLKKFYKDVFSWLFKCEKNLKTLNLILTEKKEFMVFLAERYMPFWFKKNSKTIDWPFCFF